MKSFLFVALIPILLLGGCSYDDSSLWEAMDEVKEQTEQNRQDIATLSALVEALNKGKVILATEYTNDGVKLTFSDGSSVTIKNGTNGKDGADGKDGVNGTNGKDGADGKDGANGKDGKDGTDGKDGKDGDSFFVSVVETETTVTITLADGRVIVLQKAVEGGDGNQDDSDTTYTLRTLSFEDSSAKFSPYALDYCGVNVSSWSDLIDPLQYGGDMLYSMNGGTYYWYDQGNTELAHSCIIPYWTGGQALSNYAIADFTSLPDGYYGWYELQLATPIGGHGGSANFCVHNGYVDSYNTGVYDAQMQGFEFADGVERVVDHMYVTNTCYVLNSLTVGDGFAPPAIDSSLFKIVAYGYNSAEQLVGSAELVLCEGTVPVVEWVKWDLSPLGKVAKIAFNFVPSDDLVGSYGMNTPAYFAYDDVAVRFDKNND
ncbi:MAG: DUF4465 domain-containing protein [Alistipes sp.]|nr:DUF4465 domain-containing protein [Alistipes sp.]